MQKEIYKLILYSIKGLFSRIFKNIFPAYRATLRIEKQLAVMSLMMRDMQREKVNIDSGEREIADDISKIETSHLKRYQFASNLINNGDEVLDIACGVGYGAYIISENPKVNVTGVDISQQAIQFAEKHYKRKNNNFIRANANEFNPDKLFNAIISFETIEHIEQDTLFIEKITKLLKPNGLFICSTPNELIFPYSIKVMPFHYRHYTPRQMSKRLTKIAGLKIEAIYNQPQSKNYDVIPGKIGHFTIHVARKPK